MWWLWKKKCTYLPLLFVHILFDNIRNHKKRGQKIWKVMLHAPVANIKPFLKVIHSLFSSDFGITQLTFYCMQNSEHMLQSDWPDEAIVTGMEMANHKKSN